MSHTMGIILSKRLNGVDVFKFMMAFAVITIHIQPLFKFNYPGFINWIISLAVPFFFIASGFLTARRLTVLDSIHDRIKYLRSRSLRFGKMLVIWLLIYLPLSMAYFNYSDIYILSKDIARYVINVILTGESKFA